MQVPIDSFVKQLPSNCIKNLKHAPSTCSLVLVVLAYKVCYNINRLFTTFDHIVLYWLTDFVEK